MKRTVWLVMACLAVTALVLAACGPGATTTPPTTTPPTTTPPTTTPPTTKPPVETPKYGGVVTLGFAADILGFDEGSLAHYLTYTLKLTNEELWQGDWARGPAGTGEFDWILGGVNRVDGKAPSLATSWELPDKETMVFHIRQGVKWALNPKSEASKLVNGRELTADDVVYSLKRYNTLPTSYMRVQYAGMATTTNVTAPDKWTVVIKCLPQYYGDAVSLYPDYAAIIPHEVVEKYGDMRDWRNSVGTGPFMMTDFVSNSSVTFVKNPNFWEKDPVGLGKGNQLPYVDGVKILIIPDLATRYSALRTAKIDIQYGVSWDDAASIKKTNPELIFNTYQWDSVYPICMRQDKPESPFHDVRVRRALCLALDKDQIKNVYYGGNAELLNWPVIATKEYKNAFVPLEKLPESVRELYEGYKPDKAKQLLTEAGYPNGFKATLICYNTSAQTDLMSLLKSMWAKVGVDVTIDAKEYAVWTSILVSRNFDSMLYTYVSGIGTYYKMININGPPQYNASYIDDPKVKEARAKMETLLFDEPKMDLLHAELMPYLLDQAYVIAPPWPYYHEFWSPWIKNYHGEYNVGYYNWFTFTKWIWVDEDMKKQITGK